MPIITVQNINGRLVARGPNRHGVPWRWAFFGADADDIIAVLAEDVPGAEVQFTKETQCDQTPA